LDAVNNQVLIDQYGDEKNSPSAGFSVHLKMKTLSSSSPGTMSPGVAMLVSTRAGDLAGSYLYGHYPHPVKNGRENLTRQRSPRQSLLVSGKIFNRFAGPDGRQRGMGWFRRAARGTAGCRRQDCLREARLALLGTECRPKKLLLETMRE
jgi:hypothetical protein